MSDEGLPDFSSPQEWYDIKVYQHKDTKEISQKSTITCIYIQLKIVIRGVNSV